MDKISFSANYERGYIALISALVISAVLLVISIGLSTTGFFSRFNALDYEYKQHSSALAEACVNTELLRLALNPADATTGNVTIGNDSCTVFAVMHDSPQPGQITIQAKAVFGQATTNFQLVVDKNNLSLISWQELASL